MFIKLQRLQERSMKITNYVVNTAITIEYTVKFQTPIRNEKHNNRDMRQLQIYAQLITILSTSTNAPMCTYSYFIYIHAGVHTIDEQTDIY
jgi:hypothetical protein